MGRSDAIRAMAAAGLIVAGIVAALLVGSPLSGALLALLAGVGAYAIASAGQSSEAAELPSAGSESPDLPDAASIMAAIDEPMLIVRARRILLANAPAKALLGDHIEGADIRLAIRHPAAAERLADRAPGETEEAATRTELIGLGDADRRWEMAASLLGDGSRLVRLTDRSAIHAAEQMRGDFVANASHELRTPLATILGFLETLEDEETADDPKTRTRFLNIMSREATRMRQLVDDLMSLSRIEADRFATPRDAVDLRLVIDDVRADLARLLDEANVTVDVQSTASGTNVYGDRPQLCQLLHNLVANAVKYGRPGAPVTLRIDEAGADMLRLSVIDRGEGIAPEHLPRLTERFYRIDPGRSRLVGGTGLGLAIVKHIVGRHRGRLDIASTIGEGTSVRVYLPKAEETPSSKSHSSVTQGSPSGPSEVADFD